MLTKVYGVQAREAAGEEVESYAGGEVEMAAAAERRRLRIEALARAPPPLKTGKICEPVDEDGAVSVRRKQGLLLS